MSRLKLFLFGVPRLERDDSSISISRRKGLALLAYVALRGQPQSREALATLLWPEFDQSRALSNLRRELSRLKSDLEADILEADRLQIALAPDAALWVDVKAFRQHLETVSAHDDHFPGEACKQCQTVLTEAVALHTERFLGGFHLPDAPEFDDWQFFEAEALSRAFADALYRLLQWHAGVGEYEEAIGYGRRWLALDSLHEAAHRELMALYARAGQQAAALRQYEECVRLLEEELGVEPEAETTALYEAIRTRQFPQEQEPAVPAALAAPAVLSPLPRNAPERYLVEEQIAVGGQGEVFLGRDQVTDKPVIIKRLRPELATDSARVTRFLRESQALGQLDHPNIVHMLAAFERDGYHCIVMEYVSGGTLAELLSEHGPLPLAQVLSLALELADALGRAHHLGIIHRDIKPGNVLLTEAGAPRLTDFGTARLAQEDVRLTTTGMLVGSPAYMSPEALRGDDLDPRSDIWSFGVLLYEMLAGQRPFEGDGITQILVRILGHAAPALTALRDDLPPALVGLIEQMLAKEAAERPGSMRQVAAKLEAIRDGKWDMTETEADRLRSPSRLPALVAGQARTPPPITLPDRPFAPTDQKIRFAHSADGTRIAYAIAGHGSPLVKVANPLTHLQYDWESPVWRHWVEELSREHTLIRYDERGCGLSDRQVTEFSMDAWVSDLEAVVDDLGLDHFPIIGTSQGSSVAIAYAVRHPERVSHIICCGGYARGRFHRELTPEQLAETETLLNLIRFGWGKESPAFRQVFASLFVPEGTPEQHRWFTELARVTADPEIAAQMERAFYDIDVTDLAPLVQAPTLVLHPRGDQMVPFAEGRLLADLVPDARFVPLESNNHLLLADEPAWGQFREEVSRFLQTAVEGPARQWHGIALEERAEPSRLEQKIYFCRAPDGVELAYATVGEGPPLVKAANWLSHLEYDWQSPVWHHWLTGLARQHQLIRYDERGCGLSDWDVVDMSFDAWLRDLETVVEAAGVERFPLLGISQGAAIAVAYTHRHPEKVSHLILYGGYARGRRKRDGGAEEEVRVLTDLIRMGWGQEHAAFRQVFTSLFLPEGTPEQFDAFNELQRRSSTAENAARIVEGFSQIDVSDLATQLKVPALVLHAQGDLRIPFSAGRHLASLIPGARFVPLESRNHILQEQEPAWNQFLEEVHRFLQTPAAPGSDEAPSLSMALSPSGPLAAALPAPSVVGLPATADPLIGREQDLGEIERLLTGPSTSRLLTLVGPGGIGKTRLAVATAELVAHRFPDGAVFLPLASLTAPEQIVPALAERMGLEFLEAGDEQEQLLQFLEGREQLLVLDNFEHLLDGVPLVESLLEQATDLVILATSREPLNLSSETVYRVSGLAYPAETEVSSAAVSFGAVALLLQQLQRHRPGLVPGAEEWRQLIRICRLVEGMPLALVLAANWIELLSLAEIGDEIEGSLDLLEADMRDLPARQRSVRAVFNASWEMLNGSAQAAMARLSVFRGPFSRAAAQAVAGSSLLTLRTLLNKSWLQRREERFELHELVRQYAALKLHANPGAEEEARAAHADYYLHLLEQEAVRMKGPQQEEAFARVGAAFEQIGAAWRWLVSQDRIAAIVQQMLLPLYRYCEARARASELFPLLQYALESPAAAADPALHAVLLTARSVFFATGQPIRFESMGNFVPIYLEENVRLWHLAREQELPPFWRIVLTYSYGRVIDPDEAITSLEALLAQLRAEGEEWLLAFGLQHLAMLIQYRDRSGGQVADAVIHLTEALALMERLGDLREAGYTMRVLGHLWLMQENLPEAIAQWQQALALLRQVDDWVIAAQLHWHIGDAYLQLGQVDTAFEHYRKMRELSVSRANRRFAANMVNKESYEAARYGRLELAMETRQESLALARASNDPFIEGWCLWELGELYRLRGELDEADAWFERSLQIFNRNDDNPGRCFYQRGKGELALGRGENRMARSYYGRSLALAEENDHVWAQAYALTGLAKTSLALRDVEEAAAYTVKALISARKTGDRAITLAALVATAGVLEAVGNPDLALEIAAFVGEHPVSWQEVREQARQLQDNITLPPARAAAVLERAHGQNVWDVVSNARLALSDPTVGPVSADGYSLPAYAIPFVGREKEIAELRRLLLAEPNCRLVTVLGPGGIGKTRLALQVAAQIRVSLPQGVYFVPLAPLSTPEQMVPAITKSLDIDLGSEESARQQLLDYLSDKELLLLLDNFEHILAGRDLINAILDAAPAVTILVTSREALELSAETVFPLGGLVFPDSTEAQGNFPALTLFLQQAQRLRPDYKLTDEDRKAAARICQLAQGMPLALVLAAGWFNMLSFSEIAEEMAASLDFLEGEARDLPARQQSIRGAFDYSWKHLSPDEQRTFGQLSVFRGGFTRRAARAVTSASLQTLRGLVNKSFLTAVPGERYEIHELLRQYAEAALETAGEAEEARKRHSHYYLEAIAAQREALKSRRQRRVLEKIEPDMKNVQAAILWAAAHGETQWLEEALESIYFYYDTPVYGRHEEGIALFERIVEQLPAGSLLRARFRVRQRAWQIEARRHRPQQLQEEIEHYLARFEEAGATADMAFSLFLLAEQQILAAGDFAAALTLFTQARERYAQVDDRYYLADAVAMIGYCHGVVSDLAHFERAMQEALVLSRETGNRRMEAFVLTSLAAGAFAAGAYDEAARYSEAALQVAVSLRVVGSTALAEGGIALSHILRGELSLAAPIAERGLQREREMEWRPAVMYGLALTALTAAFAGDYEQALHRSEEGVQRAPVPFNRILARWAAAIAATGLEKEQQAWQHVHEGLALAQRHDYRGLLTWFLPVSALLLHRAGLHTQAVEMLALATTHPLSPTGWLERWPLVAEARRQLETELGTDDYLATWERGRALVLVAASERLLATDPQTVKSVTAADAGEQPPADFGAAFVGRQQELAWLEEALAAAVAGEGRVCFVVGEAGQGKSALVHAFIRRAQQRYPSLLAATGYCNAYTGQGDPYLPFREILQLLTGDVTRGSAGDLPGTYTQRLLAAVPQTLEALINTGANLLESFLPARPLLRRVAAHSSAATPWLSSLQALVEAATAMPDTAAPVQQGALFAEYGDLLERVARRQPLLLCVDDLQWSDQGTANLLLHLGKRLAGQPILLVGAYRPAEVAAGRAGERHPLQQVVYELQREFGPVLLDLGESEGRALIDAMLNAEPNRLDERFRETLYAQTAGHPLFTVELLRGMQERGDLNRATDGAWIANASLDWDTLPARVEGAIGERIARLRPQLRELLQTASVVGETFPLELLAHLGEGGPRELARLFSQELDRGHRLVRSIGVRQEGGRRLSRYRFRHILIQRYLYQSMDEVERVYRHEAVAEGLETLYGADAPAVATELARHYAAARRLDRAAPYYRHAGDLARRAGALLQATYHYERALSAWIEEDVAGRAELRRHLGECAWISGQLDTAFAHLRAAYELYLASGDKTGAGAVQAAIGRLHWEQGDRRQALHFDQQALDLLEQGRETVELASVYSSISQLHMLAWEHDEAVAWGERALALARRLQAPQVLSHALNNVGFSQIWLGKQNEALANLRESKALALEHRLPHDAGRAFYNLGSALRTLDRYDEAWAEFNGMLEHGERWRVPLYAGSALAELAGVEWLMGQWRSALARRPGIQEWLARSESLTYLEILNNLVLANIASTLGQAEEALAYLEHVTSGVERTDEGQMWMPYLRARISALDLLGRQEEAGAAVEKMLTFTAPTFTMHSDSLLPLCTACYWAAEQKKWAEADALLGKITEINARLGSYSAAAIQQECSGMLSFYREKPDEAEGSLRQAVETWHRLDRPYDEARARAMLARALVAAGRDEEAEAARMRAGQLLDTLAAELDDERLLASFRASPLARAVQPGWAESTLPVPAPEANQADYQPLLAAVEEVASRQERTGHGSETMELKGIVGELQASLRAAEDRLGRMEQIEQELALARRVQQRMLPRTFPAIPGYAFATRYTPARAVGGDFYDVITLDEERLGVAIADVVGKGMPAALMMTLTRSLLLAEAPHARSPGQLLQRVNDLLLAAGDGEAFVTIFYAVLEPACRSLTYARAGHDYPFLLRAGSATELAGRGMALGVLPGDQLDLQEISLSLEPGDRLVLYSDGLTDAVAPDGVMYGKERLVEALLQHATAPVDSFCELVFDALSTFSAGTPQSDDMTMLLLEVTAATETAALSRPA